MITVRGLRDSDIPEIDRIYREKPGNDRLPGLNYQLVHCVIVNDEKIIGYGTVNVFAEATLLLDDSLSKRDKAIAFKEAMITAILGAKDDKLEILYAIVKDENFAQVLRNSYDFRTVPGTVLALDLTGTED